nr:immunoglobulin heavy chain junction region [Macaca mulatta]MOW21311.1 immunoglobulin heavy chain junction region [Macaca mulatta]
CVKDRGVPFNWNDDPTGDYW